MTDEFIYNARQHAGGDYSPWVGIGMCCFGFAWLFAQELVSFTLEVATWIR